MLCWVFFSPILLAKNVTKFNVWQVANLFQSAVVNCNVHIFSDNESPIYSMVPICTDTLLTFHGERWNTI